jgi:hypothetical protein
MDYGALIRAAWQTTWRHRLLWVLGLFAGGVVVFWNDWTLAYLRPAGKADRPAVAA